MRDEVEIKIKDPYLFISESTGAVIPLENMVIYQTLPRQLPKGVDEEQL